MKNAQLFLLTSYHEAAPMVIEEASLVGLPVLTSQTTSSADMVVQRGIGWECANSQDAINQALEGVLSNMQTLQATAERIQSGTVVLDNSEAIQSFAQMVG
jgi:glycosyltransferase involved in cell wall biosynthesis